jgi:hypothetical protein
LEIGLYVAELSAAFMGAQGLGRGCGSSNGEGLSRFLAERETAAGTLSAFATGPSWAGAGFPDWIGTTEKTDRNSVSTGCAVVYLYWMRSLGFTTAQLVQAGGATLSANYQKLTGKATGYQDLLAAIKNLTITSDNPFGATGTFQRRLLEGPTTFVNEDDGTWLMADWDRDGIPDLVFIKTNNTPNGHVEVHVASGASNYQTRVLEVATTFVNETDGAWLMADWDRDLVPDLIFVKTNNTPNGHVEVHVAGGVANDSLSVQKASGRRLKLVVGSAVLEFEEGTHPDYVASLARALRTRAEQRGGVDLFPSVLTPSPSGTSTPSVELGHSPARVLPLPHEKTSHANGA